VGIGLALAAAYYAAFVRFQVFVSRHSSTLVPAWSALGFIVRLTGFAVILVLLALLTPLNIVATAVAFLALYTIASGFGIKRALSKARRERSSGKVGRREGIIDG
jgi:uncharacterized membrane protein